MKILVILGSPRKNGNSEILARKVSEFLTTIFPAEIEYLRLSKPKLSPCRGCGSCEKSGHCAIKDDMTELYETVDNADIIILASPVYFYGPSSQVKIFIDRFQARWSRKYLLKTPVSDGRPRFGCLLMTAATKGKKLFDAGDLIARSFFDAIDVPYSGCFGIRDVDEKGSVDAKTSDLENAKKFIEAAAEKFLR